MEKHSMVICQWAMFDEGPRTSSHRGPCLDPGRVAGGVS